MIFQLVFLLLLVLRSSEASEAINYIPSHHKEYLDADISNIFFTTDDAMDIPQIPQVGSLRGIINIFGVSHKSILGWDWFVTPKSPKAILSFFDTEVGEEKTLLWRWMDYAAYFIFNGSGCNRVHYPGAPDAPIIPKDSFIGWIHHADGSREGLFGFRYRYFKVERLTIYVSWLEGSDKPSKIWAFESDYSDPNFTFKITGEYEEIDEKDFRPNSSCTSNPWKHGSKFSGVGERYHRNQDGELYKFHDILAFSNSDIQSSAEYGRYYPGADVEPKDFLTIVSRPELHNWFWISDSSECSESDYDERAFENLWIADYRFNFVLHHFDEEGNEVYWLQKDEPDGIIAETKISPQHNSVLSETLYSEELRLITSTVYTVFNLGVPDPSVFGRPKECRAF